MCLASPLFLLRTGSNPRHAERAGQELISSISLPVHLLCWPGSCLPYVYVKRAKPEQKLWLLRLCSFQGCSDHSGPMLVMVYLVPLNHNGIGIVGDCLDICSICIIELYSHPCFVIALAKAKFLFDRCHTISRI